MNYEEFDIIINGISYKLLELEEGNVMLVSELIDELNRLHPLLEKGIESEISALLERTLREAITGAPLENVSSIISDGIDHIQKIVRKKKDKKDRFAGDGKTGTEWEEAKRFIKEIKTILDCLDHGGQNPKQSKIGNGNDEIGFQLDSEPFKIFLSEAEDRIAGAQDLVLNLEAEPDNLEIVGKLFRIFHTIKGECGFLRLASFGELAHNLESLLDLLRSGTLKTDSNVIAILLKAIDCSNSVMKGLKEGDITVFNRLDFDELYRMIGDQVGSVRNTIGEILVAEGKISDKEASDILHKQKEESFRKKFGEIAIEENLVSEDDIADSIGKQNSRLGGEHAADAELRDSIVKVKASQINYLVDMVGELLIAENQFDEFDRRVIGLRKITREIQNAAMQLRTYKVKHLFLKMRRVVRDLTLKLGKEAELLIVGEGLEIDRDLVENLEEPLIHLIRNAVYHGIEAPEERVKKEKPRIGRLILKAERSGNNIVVTVEDDGNGINRAAVIEKAVKMGLTDRAASECMTDNDVFGLIFQPGLSTASVIDYVSGRGVGMDIVRNMVVNSRGRIDVQSKRNSYTRFLLVFPLSTAIIDGMIVRFRGIVSVIPVSNIIESLQIKKEMVLNVSNKSEVIDLRGEIIPLLRLADIFNVQSNNEAGSGELGIIIENSDRQKFVFIVDEIVSKREVVIKSLGRKFEKLNGISSATVLQGGRIGFVLDVDQLVRGVN
jgi:two-component system chemotaxis sensor kinase CheA